MPYSNSKKVLESNEDKTSKEFEDVEVSLKKLQAAAFLDIIQRVELALRKEKKI